MSLPSLSFGFRAQFGEYRYTLLQLPIWSIVLIATLLAIAIRPKPRFKFSLVDLLTLTTVAALTIGPLAFWLRSIS
jgi:hypothetical protein